MSIVVLFSRQGQNVCSIYVLSLAIINDLYLTLNSLIRLFPYAFAGGSIRALAYCKIRAYLSGTLGDCISVY